MKLYKRYIALGAIACGLFSGLAAHADESNQEIKFTFGTPVEIPGLVLTAGTYTFKLVDPDNGSSLVEIMNANETKVYATLETISALRAGPIGHIELKLAETGDGNVPVLTQWFYPGRTTGFQFIYPAKEDRQLEHAKVQKVIAPAASFAEMKTGE